MRGMEISKVQVGKVRGGRAGKVRGITAGKGRGS